LTEISFRFKYLIMIVGLMILLLVFQLVYIGNFPFPGINKAPYNNDTLSFSLVNLSTGYILLTDHLEYNGLIYITGLAKVNDGKILPKILDLEGDEVKREFTINVSNGYPVDKPLLIERYMVLLVGSETDTLEAMLRVNIYDLEGKLLNYIEISRGTWAYMVKGVKDFLVAVDNEAYIIGVNTDGKLAIKKSFSFPHGGIKILRFGDGYISFVKTLTNLYIYRLDDSGKKLIFEEIDPSNIVIADLSESGIYIGYKGDTGLNITFINPNSGEEIGYIVLPYRDVVNVVYTGSHDNRLILTIILRNGSSKTIMIKFEDGTLSYDILDLSVEGINPTIIYSSKVDNYLVILAYYYNKSYIIFYDPNGKNLVDYVSLKGNYKALQPIKLYGRTYIILYTISTKGSDESTVKMVVL